VKTQKTQAESATPVKQPVTQPRRRKVGVLRYLLLTCMLASAGTAFAANPAALRIAVQSIAATQPPHMVEDTLLLSLKPDKPARFVGVRFAHESWRILHPYERNENGVFVYNLPVPVGVREIRYRIVVDGLWMPDPANPRMDADQAGNMLSVFTLDKDPVRPIVNPRVESDGSVTFTYTGAPGGRVTLVGDFNNWDPFMESMEETAPGTYTITLRVPTGRHWYFFFTEGRRVLDPYNPQSGIDPDGVKVSYFSSRS
jgi:1,4-alpha-glucan branching enzyme